MMIDIYKVYDIISWDFIVELLDGYGFFFKFKNLLFECIYIFRLFISYNGDLYGFFKGERGIR